MQFIKDATIVKQAADAVNAMTVESQHDNILSTGTYYDDGFYDADGNSLFGPSFQDGMCSRICGNTIWIRGANDHSE